MAMPQNGLKHSDRLLSDIYDQMEAVAEQDRIRKAVQKKPQARSRTDIERIMRKTEEVPLMIHNGPAVHKDLCHVLKCKVLEESETMKIMGDQSSAQALYVVLSGHVKLLCHDPSVLENVLVDCGMARENGKKGRKASTRRGVTETEMVNLFSIIDTDGSGAIDAEELGRALEMMGMDLPMPKVLELIDSVDDDGSRELEFPEFKRIIVDQLGLGDKPQTKLKWEQNHQGEWCKEYSSDTWFGEKCVLEDNVTMSVTILAVNLTTLGIIEKSDYDYIKENGFDGDLSKKVNLLQELAPIKSSIQNTDLRSLAYLTRVDSRTMKAVICHEGEPALSLHIVLEGECKVVKKTSSPKSVVCLPPEWNIMPGIHKPLTKRLPQKLKPSNAINQIEVALLTSGDIFGQDSFGEVKAHRTSTIAATDVVFLSVDVKDLERTLHPKDMENLYAIVKMTASWREKHIMKAMETVSLAKSISMNPDTKSKKVLRKTKNPYKSQGCATKSLTNLFPNDARRLPIISVPSAKAYDSGGSLTSRAHLGRGSSLPVGATSDRSHYQSSHPLVQHNSLPADFQPCGLHFREEIKRRWSVMASFIPSIIDAESEPVLQENASAPHRMTSGSCIVEVDSDEREVVFPVVKCCSSQENDTGWKGASTGKRKHLFLAASKDQNSTSMTGPDAQQEPIWTTGYYGSSTTGGPSTNCPSSSVTCEETDNCKKQEDNISRTKSSLLCFWDTIMEADLSQLNALESVGEKEWDHPEKSPDDQNPPTEVSSNLEPLKGSIKCPDIAQACDGSMPARRIRHKYPCLKRMEECSRRYSCGKMKRIGGVTGRAAGKYDDVESESTPNSQELVCVDGGGATNRIVTQNTEYQSSDSEEFNMILEQQAKCTQLVRDESQNRRVKLFVNLLDGETSTSWRQLKEDYVGLKVSPYWQVLMQSEKGKRWWMNGDAPTSNEFSEDTEERQGASEEVVSDIPTDSKWNGPKLPCIPLRELRARTKILLECK